MLVGSVAETKAEVDKLVASVVEVKTEEGQLLSACKKHAAEGNFSGGGVGEEVDNGPDKDPAAACFFAGGVGEEVKNGRDEDEGVDSEVATCF